MGSDPEAVDRDQLIPEEGEDREPSFFGDPKRLAQTLVVVLALVAAIYILLPRVVGIQDSLAKLGDATPAWIVAALIFNVLVQRRAQLDSPAPRAATAG